MGLISILIKDHALVRAALESFETQLGPALGCGWEDRVKFDAEQFHRDLDALSRVLREHEALEEKLVASWLKRFPACDPCAERILLRGHENIDSLLKLFSAVAQSIADGRVYAARTVLSRLSEELARHMEEEERDLFPRLRELIPATEGSAGRRAS